MRKTLHALVVWLGICDGNMQEGSFRCDANVSVRPVGQQEFGTRAEIKNLNSFRFLEEAISVGSAPADRTDRRRRHRRAGNALSTIRTKRETRSMRSKEDAHDYRYFPDPDPDAARHRPGVDQPREGRDARAARKRCRRVSSSNTD